MDLLGNRSSLPRVQKVMICDSWIRSVLFVSVFQGWLLLIVVNIMIDGSEKRISESGF